MAIPDDRVPGDSPTKSSYTKEGYRRLGREDRRMAKTSERVAHEIVHDIVTGDIVTGDRLPLEVDMIERYGVSRMSMREALRILEVQGLIMLKPGPPGGPVVRDVDPSYLARNEALYFHFGRMTYRELFETQKHMEASCARLAAANPDRVRVKTLLASFLGTDQPLAGNAYRDAAEDFHLVLYELADNRVTALLTHSIAHMVSSHVVSSMDPVPLRKSIMDFHRDIAKAVVSGQVTKAEKLMSDHLQEQIDFYRQNWPAKLDELIEWR